MYTACDMGTGVLAAARKVRWGASTREWPMFPRLVPLVAHETDSVRRVTHDRVNRGIAHFLHALNATADNDRTVILRIDLGGWAGRQPLIHPGHLKPVLILSAIISMIVPSVFT
jgi:hypothetical protein